MTAGVTAGLAVSAILVHRLRRVKWQLIWTCVAYTVFIGGIVAVDGSNLALAVVLSLLAGINIGYMEDITVSGGTLMLDPKDIGLAAGVQQSMRQLFSGAASKASENVTCL